MPKYRKRRFNYAQYPPLAFPGVQMGMPMPLYPLPLMPSPLGSVPLGSVPGPVPGPPGSVPGPVPGPPGSMPGAMAYTGQLPHSPLPHGQLPHSPLPKNLPHVSSPVPASATPAVPEEDVRSTDQLGESLPRPLTKSEKACLPFFTDELKHTVPREPTDIVIIDFDRTLLATPLINRDLFDRPSRDLLEFRLGLGHSWWQSPLVLEAAIAQGQWNTDLLEVARDAAESSDIVLVITTARNVSELAVIKQALAGESITHVDHFACSSHSDIAKDGLDAENRDADKPETAEVAVLGGWAKQAMLELLLESYDCLERVFVFDNNKGDKHKYSRAVAQFVRDGWLNAEAFHLLDFALKPAPTTDSLVAQRELVHRVLEHAAVRTNTSVVVLEWLHKLTIESQREMAEAVAGRLGEHVDRILCEDINISKGSLPPDMRARVHRGAYWQWTVTGYRVENRILWLQLEGTPSSADGPAPCTADFKAARLVREFNEETSLHTLMQSPTIKTFVYERRELRVQKEKA